MQVKVKNSRELRRYVSQNIQSNCWNSTVNIFGVLAKLGLVEMTSGLVNASFSLPRMASCKNDFLYTLLGKAWIPFLFFLELKFYLNHAPEGPHNYPVYSL